MMLRSRYQQTGSVNFYIKCLIFSPGFKYPTRTCCELVVELERIHSYHVHVAKLLLLISEFVLALLDYQDGYSCGRAANCKTQECAGKDIAS